MKEKEILLRAAEIVRERWQQHDNGFRGCPRCMLGAHAEATDDVFGTVGGKQTDESALAYERSLEAIRPHIPGGFITAFNDASGRTAEEVAQVFEKVAKEFE